jgi:flagellar biosynthesis/type III secretory pathway protein FliH
MTTNYDAHDLCLHCGQRASEIATLRRQLEEAREKLASYEPSPEDIAAAQESADREAAARDRAERNAYDQAYDEGYRAGRRGFAE